MNRWSILNLKKKYGGCYFSYDNSFLNYEKVVDKSRDSCDTGNESVMSRTVSGCSYDDDSENKNDNDNDNNNNNKDNDNDNDNANHNNNDTNSNNYDHTNNNDKKCSHHNDKGNYISDLNNRKNFENSGTLNEDSSEPKVIKLTSFLKEIDNWNNDKISEFYDQISGDLNCVDIDIFPDSIDDNIDINTHDNIDNSYVNINESTDDEESEKHEKISHMHQKYSPNPPYIFDSTFDFGDSSSLIHDYTVPSIFNGNHTFV